MSCLPSTFLKAPRLGSFPGALEEPHCGPGLWTLHAVATGGEDWVPVHKGSQQGFHKTLHRLQPCLAGSGGALARALLGRLLSIGSCPSGPLASGWLGEATYVPGVGTILVLRGP